MRERTATQSILTETLLKARQSDARHIKSVHIAIGDLAELDPNSIREHWAELGRGTAAEGAGLHFRPIRGEVQCMACFEEYHPTDGKIHCPHCGSYGAKILSGEELYVESIDLGS